MFATSMRQPSAENGGSSQRRRIAPPARVHRLAQPGVAVVELGQRLDAQPRLVVVGPRAEHVVAGGRGRRIGLRGDEPRVLGAGVVGRDVEDQRGCRARASRAAATTRASSPPKCAATWLVVDRVVAVVRARVEDGVEVDRVDAEVRRGGRAGPRVRRGRRRRTRPSRPRRRTAGPPRRADGWAGRDRSRRRRGRRCPRRRSRTGPGTPGRRPGPRATLGGSKPDDQPEVVAVGRPWRRWRPRPLSQQVPAGPTTRNR